MTTPTSKFRVPFDGEFKISSVSTKPPSGAHMDKAAKKALKVQVSKFADLQERLYAADKNAVLLIFQAMDAAGKDSTIRAVTSGVNPAGFQITSFKAPSSKELDHDFLWRTNLALPERGRIGIFNRSHYEETLVVRVHPELLDKQRLPEQSDAFWSERFESIRNYESHLARSGTLILKFWLNVSRKTQLQRFSRRLERPDKNWKFSPRDIDESERWDDYMQAYEAMLNATSRPEAPWFAIPADHKPFMRLAVAEIICDALMQLDPQYPKLASKDEALLPDYKQRIESALSQLPSDSN